MVKIITIKDNLSFLFNCVNILMYEDDYSDKNYTGDFYRNKSETLIFNGYQIKSFEKVICQRDENDGCMIISTFESLKENYKKSKINHHTKKHIEDLMKIIKMNTIDFGILYSNKEIQEMEIKNKGNVEIIKSKWLIQNVKCSIENIKETCSIDLDEYDKIVKTECGHFFSIENLYEWLRNNNKDSCPLCRTIIIDK
jgi:hypothetical protein